MSLKPVRIGKYTIVFREGKWVVLIGSVTIHSFDSEKEAKRYASGNL